MSKESTNIFRIELPSNLPYFCLSKDKGKGRTIYTFMTFITEEEEECIDKGSILFIKRGGRNFRITNNDIYCYGNIDFNNDSEDMEQIATFPFLDYLRSSGVPIVSDYNYKEHVCNSPIHCCRWTETWRPEVLVKLGHGYLGKPEKIVVFKKTIYS